MATDREETAPPVQRIDKWLWHARFIRTRTAAQRLVQSGHVRVNRSRVTSAGHRVRAGDVLTIALTSGVRVVVVNDIAARRGSADVARLLYQERTDPTVGKRAAPLPDAVPHIVSGPRPDRRSRRIAAALKRSEME